MNISQYDPLTAVDTCNKLLEVCRENQEYFTVLDETGALQQAQEVVSRIKSGERLGPLAGVFVSVKDNICVKGIETTATSRILRGYRPIHDSHVIARLRQAGAIIIGKTTMDEFGFGSFNTNVGLGYPVPSNPHDPSRVTGGSSGGSAALTAVLKDFPHVSIAESTGGSIECPASYCGVYGYCPTYGAVSRQGLISYANSLDKIGVMANSPEDVKLVMSVISGLDSSESTGVTLSSENPGVRRIGVVTSILDRAEPEVKDAFERFLDGLQDVEVVPVDLPITEKFGTAAYYVIAMCEASTNLACLSGLRYGQQDQKKNLTFSEYFSSVRSEHFNTESKRRIMIGTFARMAGYRGAFYDKASAVRSQIITEYRNAFEKVDMLIAPTMPTSAPEKSAVEALSPAQIYAMDFSTVGANLAGIPHVSVPLKTDSLPMGVQLCCDQRMDVQLIDFINEVRP